MEYFELFSKLAQYKVRYLICGGLAVNIYGIPRMTADIDILLDFTEDNLQQFEAAIKILKYQSVIPVSIKTFVSKEERQKVISEKNLMAYSYFNSIANYLNLDVLINVPLNFEEMWNARQSRKMDNTDVYLVSVEHLILLKQFANRKQDNDDILLLSKLIKK